MSRSRAVIRRAATFAAALVWVSLAMAAAAQTAAPDSSRAGETRRGPRGEHPREGGHGANRPSAGGEQQSAPGPAAPTGSAAADSISASSVQAAAGSASPQLVDRVVALVDEEPILQSDVDREVETARWDAEQAHQTLPSDDGVLRKEMLDRLIQVKLLVAQAKLDGITIGEDELNQAVARSMDDMIQRFGTRRELEQELQRSGMTYADLEARNRELIRNRMYTSRIVATHIRPLVEVREDEVRKYYDEHKSEIPTQPATVTLANILVVPQPSEETQKVIQQKLALIQGDLNAGASFEDVARKYSEDANAKEGGKLGTFAKGDLFNGILEDAAWSQPVGVVGQPITTEIGVHLLRVDARTDSTVTLSQIMLRLTITDAEWKRADERAKEVAALARSGRDFAELAKNYSDDPTSREKGGALGTFSVNELSPTFKTALSGLNVGEVADPVRGEAGYFVLKLLKKEEAKIPSYEEVADHLRQAVEDQKIQAELDKYLASLRTKFYIDVKT